MFRFLVADGKKVFLNTLKVKFTLEHEKKPLRGAEA